jgi:very-short-patch-repair endonuclease
LAAESLRVGAIHGQDLDPSMIKETSINEGPKRLRQFLEYAKAVDALNKDSQKVILSQINPDMERKRSQRRLEFDSEFEVQVHSKLEQKGFKVDTHIGFSGYTIDLAIVHPKDHNRYVLGIECDGATFHSAKSVKERDVARQKFLESKGWKIARVWSRSWWKNPDQEVAKIESKINQLIAN